LDLYTKQKSGQAKEETLFRLKELVAEEADNDEVRFFLVPFLLSFPPSFTIASFREKENDILTNPPNFLSSKTVNEKKKTEQIISYLNQQFKMAILPETEFIILMWNGLISMMDMGAAPGQLNDGILKEITVRLFLKLSRILSS
jgi:hypothetical protein